MSQRKRQDLISTKSFAYDVSRSTLWKEQDVHKYKVSSVRVKCSSSGQRPTGALFYDWLDPENIFLVEPKSFTVLAAAKCSLYKITRALPRCSPPVITTTPQRKLTDEWLTWEEAQNIAYQSYFSKIAKRNVQLQMNFLLVFLSNNCFHENSIHIQTCDSFWTWRARTHG